MKPFDQQQQQQTGLKLTEKNLSYGLMHNKTYIQPMSFDNVLVGPKKQF